MKHIVWVALIAGALRAQPVNLQVVGVTNTQAILSYMAPGTDACTVEVSESSAYTPLVNDVNGGLFPGSNSDSGRALTSAGLRYFIVGTRTSQKGSDGRMYSRALRADALHYARVTCGTPATVTFSTAQIRAIAPEALPFDPDGHGNFAFPDRDYTSAGRNTPVYDPQTGAASYMITNPKDYSHAAEYSFASGVYFQGGSWTNPSNITAASPTSTASTSAANAPIVVIPDLSAQFVLGNWTFNAQDGPLVDLGLHAYGSGSDSSAQNRQIGVCVSVDSGQTCYTNEITITMPRGTADAGLFPSTFPVPGAPNDTWSPFVGWGKIIPRNYASFCTVSVTGGVVAVPYVPDDVHSWCWLNPDWAVGSKYYVAGSNPTCPNNYCTIASVDNDLQLTLQENLTISNASSHFAGISFRIRKLTGTGTVNLSTKYGMAKYYAFSNGPGNGCSPTTVTVNVDRLGNPINPGVVGRLCVFEQEYQGPSALYFVGESKPDFRLLSLFRPPDNPPAGYVTQDEWPFQSRSYGPTTNTVFDPNNPRVIYLGITLQGPKFNKAIFKLTYTGDGRETTGLFFRAGNDTGLYTYVNDSITWENLTRSSQGRDLRSQILANSSYNEATFGSLGNIAFAGIASGKAIYYNIMGQGPQNNPCWIHIFDGTTGNWVSSWNSVQGTGADGFHFAGCHAIQPIIGRALVSNDLLTSGNGFTFAGPFDVIPTNVYRNGALSTNTALPTLFDGSYDGACPSDIAQKWKDRGATGNHCVAFRIPTQPCSVTPSAVELAAYPCPGVAGKSYIGLNIGPGDELYDANGLGGADSEHFLIVKVTPASGNQVDIVAVRNAGLGYCCLISQQGDGSCAQADSQAIHASGWTARATALGTCAAGNSLVSVTDSTDVLNEHQIFARGHFGYELTSPGRHNFVGASINGTYRARFDAPVSVIGTFSSGFQLPSSPAFNSVSLDSTVVQSYVSVGLGGLATDWRHFNGPLGLTVERQGQTVGPNLTTALVAGQSNTYKVTGFTAPDIKVQPVLFWAGLFHTQDLSSPASGDRISDANGFRHCYAYRANECRAGSSVGDLYVVVPKLNAGIAQCSASQVGRRIPCAFAAGPLAAQTVQVDASASDSTGVRQRRIGPNLTRYGAQYVYTKTRPFSATQPVKFFATQFHLQGLVTGAALIDPGGWNQSSQPGNNYTFIPVQVPVQAGATQARIRFGYADYGTQGSNFYCTSRAEDCLTDAMLKPYAFAGDSLTPTACASGCTIPIPATPGRIVLFRIEWLNAGTVVSTGAMQLMAVP
jgi:hypothetical protein